MGRLPPRFTIGIGLLVIMASLSACTAPSAAPPATQKTATGSPARGGRREEPAGAATAVAAAGCEGFAAWLSDPDINTALKNTDFWPELITAGDTAAAGGAVDQGRMKQINDQIARAPGTIRNSAAASQDEALTEPSSRAMVLAAKLARGLADGSLSKKVAGDTVIKLKDAIDVYTTEVAAQEACCG